MERLRKFHEKLMEYFNQNKHSKSFPGELTEEFQQIKTDILAIKYDS